MDKEQRPPSRFSEGELRRFVLKTDDPEQIRELDDVVEKKRLTRRDLGVITLFLAVRPGFLPADFGIGTRNTQEHLSGVLPEYSRKCRQ